MNISLQKQDAQNRKSKMNTMESNSVEIPE